MLLTTVIEKKLQEQYLLIWNQKANCMQMDVVCKVMHPFSSWTWYLISQDPEDKDHLWAIVDAQELEIGSVPKNELEKLKILNLHCEIDTTFKPIKAQELYNALLKKRS